MKCWYDGISWWESPPEDVEDFTLDPRWARLNKLTAKALVMGLSYQEQAEYDELLRWHDTHAVDDGGLA